MGSVVVSLDAELGWGFHDIETPPRERLERARWGWRETLALLDEYDVPATWGVVGHLMLETCDGRHESHPTAPDWFARERADWADRPDRRFGPELVSAVVDSPVDHEIACHSFSHVRFGDPTTSAELARAECERAIEVADERGLSLESFIFPRNEVGHRDVLAASGFLAYRSREPAPEGAVRVLGDVVRSPSLLVTPRIDDVGLVDVPPSLFAFGFEGRLRRLGSALRLDPIVVLARRGIDQAAAGDGIFHLWFHPNNVTTREDVTRLRRILSYVDRVRSRTDLQTETMASVARRTLSSAPTGEARAPSPADQRPLATD
ncbi:polysaccharide deacetylase family protein [Halovivax limisalsi]|uniref:polysaccharide deacetylase family protein n=1 Tax=Halovivax limisalsi TaxID=1453760 RepID=UPI001FFC6981|nr:polysaccharide deacetylase family protein [Halovivax limisalsi]